MTFRYIPDQQTNSKGSFKSKSNFPVDNCLFRGQLFDLKECMFIWLSCSIFFSSGDNLNQDRAFR